MSKTKKTVVQKQPSANKEVVFKVKATKKQTTPLLEQGCIR